MPTMMDTYFIQDAKYTEKYGNNCIFLMQCGTFFEVYGRQDSTGNFVNDKIENFARICDMTIASKSTPGRNGKKHQTYKGCRVFMAGFSPIERLDKYVMRLTESGFVVPVWVQDEKVPSIRSELGVYTPGTNFNLKSREITNNIMCIWINKKEKTLINKNPVILCGMSSIDIYTGTSNMFEFKEQYFHNPTTYDEIERFYTTYNPNEIIFIYNCDEEHLEEVIKFSAIECETIHKFSSNNKEGPFYKQIENCDSQQYQKELLERFYDINDYTNFFDSFGFREYSMATLSFCFLLNFIFSIQPNMVKKIKAPEFNNTTDRLVLANHSAKQLNIISTNNYSGRMSSVISFLNRCKTPMGKRSIKKRILNPITNIANLKKEYEIIEYAKNSYGDFKATHGLMTQICDFERLYRKIVLKRVTPAELVQFNNNLKLIKIINNQMLANDTFKTYLKNENLSQSYKKIAKVLKKHLNFKAAGAVSTNVFEDNIFNSGIFPELDKEVEYYYHQNESLHAIRKYLESFISKYEKNKRSVNNYVKEHKTEKSGLYFEITKRRSEILKREMLHVTSWPVELSYISQYDKKTHLVSFDGNHMVLSSGTGNNKKIETPLLRKLYSDVISQKFVLKKKLKEVYSDFVDSLQEYKKDMETLIDFIVSVDVLFTKSKLALDFNYCKPVIDDTKEKSFIDAKDMRHLLIEHIQQDEIYVPNDVKLGRDSEDGILLYGTNAVGKSSLIKSIGICVILAQAGFFVPCSNFVYKPYKKLFTRILGNDNLFKGLSTFAVEMSELRVILKNSGQDSLVLGDEVCSGTETISAISIFLSALLTLHEKNSSFIFATHLHEIVKMDYLKKIDRTKMMHMAIRCDSNGVIIYDRKLKAGSGSNIYGLEVCKSLHMPNDFLIKAHEIRRSIYPEDKEIMSANKTRYNSNKIKGNCELCGGTGVDIHHMIPQKESNDNKFIGSFHQNHAANLMNLCKQCHNKETISNRKLRKTKTSEGMKYMETF
tara:strand:+ start:1706 stop:4696 length:2991 start_codon:yes stop_codon:yes gene_type:complete